MINKKFLLKKKKMKFKVLPLFFALFEVILANQEFHESPGEGRCNAFFRCPLKGNYIN